VIYPPSFSLAMSTKYPTSERRSMQVISSVVEFQTGTNSSGLPVGIDGYPLSTTNGGCPAGYGWRFIKIGQPAATACSCPANTLCSGQTSCSVVPMAGDSWQVVEVPTSLCTATNSTTSPFKQSTTLTLSASATNPIPSNTSLINSVYIPQNTPGGSDSVSKNLALGLGLGLGLGLPVVLAAIYGVYSFMQCSDAAQPPGTALAPADTAIANADVVEVVPQPK